MSDNKIMRAEELARELDLEPETVRLWGRLGRIPRIVLSPKVIRYRLSDVLDAVQVPRLSAMRDTTIPHPSDCKAKQENTNHVNG